MRTTGDDARDEQISNLLISPNVKRGAVYTLEAYKDGVPQINDDVDGEIGISFSEGGKKLKFASHALTPLTGDLGFTILNEGGKYSEGSGTIVEELFDTETKIRIKAGYILPTTDADADTVLDLNDISGTTIRSFFFHTSFNGSGIDIDSASVLVNAVHFRDLFLPLYDSVNYDSTTYSADGYTVQTYDTQGIGFQEIVKFTLTSDNSIGTIYYRTFNNSSDIGVSFFSNWTNAGSVSSGVNTIAVGSDRRFLQVAVLYDGITWGVAQEITEIKVTHGSYVEFLYTSIYYLDTPDFDDPASPQVPRITCEGRDVWKRMIGTQINIPDMSGTPLKPDALAKNIAGQANVPFTATSIDDLSAFSSTTWADGFEDIQEADKGMELIMQKINPVGYQMYTRYDSTEDENVLFITIKPTIASAIGALSFRNYVSVGSNKKNADKQLQRLTVISDQNTLLAEEELDTAQVISTTGVKVFSWAGNAQYKRISADKPDDIEADTTVITPTSITFTVTAITGSVTISVFGNKWKSTEPTYQGEAINFQNMISGKGTTARTINPLVTSDSEAKSVAESFIADFATPVNEAKELIWPYVNLLPDINDTYLLWRRFIFNDDIFFITKGSHTIARDGQQSTSFALDDTGANFSDLGDFIYDDIMDYDSGFLYDMGISKSTDTNAEIDAATIIVKNGVYA